MRAFEEFIFDSWWVAALLLIAYAIYDMGIEKVEKDYDTLNQKKMALIVKMEHALEKQKKLQTDLASVDDPLWVELVLKEKLGVAERGETKVYFFRKGEEL